MRDIDLEGLKSAADFAKQLITLSTGILAVSITFIKDILQGKTIVIGWVLKLAWVGHLMAIVFGMFAISVVTGHIFIYRCDPAFFNCGDLYFTADNKPPIYPAGLKFFGILQVLTFLSATILLIVFGAKTLKAMKKEDGGTNVDGDNP